MKKFLCIIVALFALNTLATACGIEKQHIEREVVTFDSESKLFVPIGLLEDKEWVEQNISINASTYNVDEMIRYVERFKKDGALPYKCKGCYNLESFETEKRTFYIFAEPNDFYEVMTYDDWQGFAFVIHHTGDHGVSVGSVYHGSGNFYGLTKNCVLFQEKDGSITAVHFKEKNRHPKVGDKEYPETSLEELSPLEKWKIVRPIGWYNGDNEKIIHRTDID